MKMESASLQFVAFGLLVALVSNFRRSVAWRQFVLLIASLWFLLFFSRSPAAYVPLAGFLLFGFVSLRLMQKQASRSSFAVLLIATVAGFVWLKRYTFIPGALLLPYSYLTLGLSYIFFRVVHLIIDARDDIALKQVSAIDYLNYTLNFTTLVSGPIQRYQDFARDQLSFEPLTLNLSIIGRALERIVIGFFKVNVLSVFLSEIKAVSIANVLSSATPREKLINGILIVASYPFYLYCNFSGYIDIVIGIARLLRLDLPENFNRPFSSDNFMTFWSRWHITLSQWLRTYVYSPLLICLMRRFSEPAIEPFLGVIAFFVTFFLVGVWHGQTSEFLFFGLLQGAGVSAVKLYQILMVRARGRKQYKAWAGNPIYNAFARGLTFTWFAFTLLWFWSGWTDLRIYESQLGLELTAAMCVLIFLCATAGLEIWERLRMLLLSYHWQGRPVLATAYAENGLGYCLGTHFHRCCSTAGMLQHQRLSTRAFKALSSALHRRCTLCISVR